MSFDQFPAVHFGGYRTLPVVLQLGKTLEPISQFSSGAVEVQSPSPDYEIPVNCQDEATIAAINNDPDAAALFVKKWYCHLSTFLYFAQFKDDSTREKIRALHDHTKVMSTLCDSRLGIDPTELWTTFDLSLSFERVENQYRVDVNRDDKWSDYAARLLEVWKTLSGHLRTVIRLAQRMETQIQLRREGWRKLLRISPPSGEPRGANDILLFYSYSHRDEQLRDQLVNHLATLRHLGIIKHWHDRMITAGNEWKGQIDRNLELAKIILLLVSADFIASEYCFDIEMRRAMERHDARVARVIPVIVRACDWSGVPFGHLQALPDDARPVTSWSNQDEAFTNVAKGIRKVVEELRLSQ